MVDPTVGVRAFQPIDPFFTRGRISGKYVEINFVSICNVFY